MPLDKLNLPKEDYQQLCSKAIADKLSPAEKIQLEAWLDQSKKNRIYYNDIKRLWQQTDWSVPPETPDIHDEWHHLAHSLSLQAKKKTKQGALVLDRIQRFIISLHGRYRIVLALAAVILLITGIYFLQFLSKPSIYTLSTQSAEKKYILE